MITQYNCASQTKSLYIHWPFCPYKCHFCPFVALASQDQFMPEYHAALCKEIEKFHADSGQRFPLETIYFGGGTPSTYPPKLLLDTFAILNKSFVIDNSVEITLEVNPGTVDDNKLDAWSDAGINRLSVGVQSLNDRVLHGLNRLQTMRDVYDVLARASKRFLNISVDLILGLPGIKAEEWKKTLYEVSSWQITHLAVYFLTVHEDTPLYFKVKSGRMAIPKDQAVVDLYLWSCDLLEGRGFIQYELSNFARPGFESRHNQVYWDRRPYKAFGIGACSFDGTHRFRNEKNLTKYMVNAQAGIDTVDFVEELSQGQVIAEKVMLGLRCTRGVDRSTITLASQPERKLQAENEIERLLVDGFLKEVDGKLRLTQSGLVVENEVLARLLL